MAFIIFSFLLSSHLFFTPASTPATPDGRVWMGDAQSRYTRSPLISSSAMDNFTDVDPVPSKYLRISHFQFSYAFQVNPGQKLILLHFNPVSHRGFRKYKDFSRLRLAVLPSLVTLVLRQMLMLLV
ncbi:hypothetical protein Pfo_010997 [Paulownia fortunei]|nr:hypothetical protein Pfo_010997 [Paulownia fortunei]